VSTFVLKIIAVFFMIVDHVKYALPSCYNDFTLYFGRIAFPIFAFCLVQGYIHTHDWKRYVKRLLLFGIISELPYLLFNSLPLLNQIGLNVIITFLLAVLAIKVYEVCNHKRIGILGVIVIAFLASFIKADYGAFGILLVFSFYIFQNSKWKMLLVSTVIVCGKYLYRILALGVGFTEYPIKNWICTLIPLGVILFYNGKRGPKLKWFFYIFYPVHLLILYIISPYALNLLHL